MSCEDYRNEPDFPGCCDSCHDDTPTVDAVGDIESTIPATSERG